MFLNGDILVVLNSLQVSLQFIFFNKAFLLFLCLFQANLLGHLEQTAVGKGVSFIRISHKHFIENIKMFRPQILQWGENGFASCKYSPPQ